MDSRHRSDIDGLRSVAILPVLFYHANIWPFSGGYVGVDVFFVISGYLITGLILREQGERTFTLANFYDRRARRILPALAAMLVAATIAALFILLPDELDLFGKYLAASVLFFANILFWLNSAAYFAPDAAQNPLLHVWSLSVEEQFYLIWPLALIGLVRFRRALPLVIGVLTAASLALALYYAVHNPNVAFYLLPTRAWQLLAGAFLATGRLVPLRNAIARNITAVGGFAFVAAAALLPGGVAFYHPWNALGAVLGTTLILYAADGGTNIVSAVLATRVPVFIGQISYSLYLWHWPALVFTRLYLNRALSLPESVAVLLVVFVVSTLSWKFIEQPIRRRKLQWRGWPASFPFAAAAGVLFVAVALGLVLSKGLPLRVPADARAAIAEGDKALGRQWCDSPNAVVPACLLGNPSFQETAVLWGDSHARALADGLVGFADRRRLRLRLMTLSSCPPLPGLDFAAPDGSPRPKCRALNTAAFDDIMKDKSVRLVILEARWEAQITLERIAPPVRERAASALDRLLVSLGRRGIAVLIVGNVPLLPDIPGHCYGRQRLFGRDPAACEAIPLAQVSEAGETTDLMIARAAASHPNVRAYFPATALCDRRVCHAFDAGHVLYRDTHHLSAAGSLYVGRALDAALRNWPG